MNAIAQVAPAKPAAGERSRETSFNSIEESYEEYEMNERKFPTKQPRSTTQTESQIFERTYSFIRIDRSDYEKHRDGIDSDFDVDEVEDSKLSVPKISFKFLIIDCSPVNFVDTVGVKAMKQVRSRFVLEIRRN